MAILSNLNDLNSPPSLPPPDILENIIHVPCEERRPNTVVSRCGATISHNPNTLLAAVAQNFQCRCNACRKGLKKPSKSRQRFMRGLCCLGWIFCCPVFTLTCALRTAPVDKQDLQEDECYPCFSAPTS